MNRQSCIPFDEHVFCENGFVAMLEIIERQLRIVRQLQFPGRGQRKRLSTERKGKKEKRERRKNEKKNKKKNDTSCTILLFLVHACTYKRKSDDGE